MLTNCSHFRCVLTIVFAACVCSLVIFRAFAGENFAREYQFLKATSLDNTSRPARNRRQIRKTFVTALYDLASLNDPRSGSSSNSSSNTFFRDIQVDVYVDSFRQLASLISGQNNTLFVFHDDADEKIFTKLKTAASGNPYVLFRKRKLKDTPLGRNQERVLQNLKKMKISPDRPTGPSDLLKYNSEKMLNYIVINHAKMYFLMEIAHNLKITATEVKTLAWIDIGAFQKNRDHSAGLTDDFGCMDTKTAKFAITKKPWPYYWNSVFLAGNRREVAGGVMIFNVDYLLNKFGPYYFNELLFMLDRGKITSEQGFLSYLVQTLDEVEYVPSGYSHLYRNMLNCVSTMSSYREQSRASKLISMLYQIKY
uniref:Uncharacterized protein n=1 Tax=Aplanochytrium stocchinoi TaxID=215587 RepID=A0A7S3PNK4_9STRA|mmetsp:Transcript_5328/g.6723  ORF Transcript_5328/g.6723 Transcript_5328/m.6723 type:complete len:367 (+) Transcript_5328:251-1351(+)